MAPHASVCTGTGPTAAHISTGTGLIAVAHPHRDCALRRSTARRAARRGRRRCTRLSRTAATRRRSASSARAAPRPPAQPRRAGSIHPTGGAAPAAPVDPARPHLREERVRVDVTPRADRDLVDHAGGSVGEALRGGKDRRRAGERAPLHRPAELVLALDDALVGEPVNTREYSQRCAHAHPRRGAQEHPATGSGGYL